MQVNYEHYCKKFKETKALVTERQIEVAMSASDINTKNLREELEKNSPEFRKFVHNVAKQIINPISNTTYAAVVAHICENLGMDYRPMTGLALPSTVNNFEYQKASAEKTGDNYVCNHVYLIVNGKYYEYFNGETTNICHIKEKEMC